MTLNPKQLDLKFDQPRPIIWQWDKLSPQTKEIVLEWAKCDNPKMIKTLLKKDTAALEPWLKCTLNWSMKLVSHGWVDLRFD